MAIGLTVYFGLSLLATIVGFSASILGSRADRWVDASVHHMSERQLSGTYSSGDERERYGDPTLATSGHVTSASLPPNPRRPAAMPTGASRPTAAGT